jgi:hypothetical protein
MGLEIIVRRGADQQRRREAVANRYADQRVKIDKMRDLPRQRPEKEIREESRAKLEQRGIFKSD